MLLCVLLAHQQTVFAQSCQLGKQKTSFSYSLLYKNSTMKKAIAVEEKINTTTKVQTQQEKQEIEKAQVQQDLTDIPKIEQVNSQLKSLAPKLHAQGVLVYTVLKIYNKIYKSLLNAGRTQELMKIQAVMLNYFNTHKNAYTSLESELINASSVDEQVKIFLSYSK